MKTNELKCTDLRIGNYVNIEGDVVKVKEIYEKSIHYANSEYESYATEDFIQPIELTEEVLVKIGFGKRNDCYTLSNEYIFFVYYKDSFKQELLASVKRKGKCYYNTNELKNYDIKYLHQLQNAYYCLTNEELNIEL